MKLRIHRNSLRIRLDDDDLDKLIESGCVTEQLRSTPGAEACLVYSVETLDSVDGVRAKLANGRIRIFIRPESARSLADESEVAVEASQANADAPELRLLVEKEFLP